MISEKVAATENTTDKVSSFPMLKNLPAQTAILLTRKGTLYHMTNEIQKISEVHAVQINLSDFLGRPILNLLQKEKLGLLDFLNLKFHTTFLNYHSPNSERFPKGSNDEKSVQVYGKGYYKLDNEEYINLVKFIKPDFVTSLTEFPDYEKGGKKSHQRAMKKSIDFFTEMQKELADSSVGVLAPIFPSKIENILAYGIKALSERNPVAYHLMAFDALPVEERFSQLAIIMKLLEEEQKTKAILLASRGEPIEILRAMSLGINYFESDYPFALSKTHRALILEVDQFNPEVHNDEGFAIDSLQGKKVKTVDMIDVQHKSIWEPISHSCDCYACKNHTRGYLKHLLECDEMNAYILINLHNISEYSRFLRVARKAIQAGNFNAFAKFVRDNFTVDA